MDRSPSTTADQPACILAIATTTPEHVVQQSSYPDYYFRLTGGEPTTDLKQKFEKLCKNSGIKTRHMALTEEHLKACPAMCEYEGNSLNARQKLACVEVIKLAKQAAEKVVAAWGQPLSSVTHLLFVTGSSVDMPGADVVLANRMGLDAGVKRMMFYMQGCASGAGLLRVAKDVAENNPGSRVLVVCGDVATVATFRAPSGPEDIPTLIGQSVNGDGMAALIVGASPTEAEKPLFEIHAALSHLIPHSEGEANGHVTEAGFTFFITRDFLDMVAAAVPRLLFASPELKRCLNQPRLSSDTLNSCFWAFHAGGRRMLDALEEQLGLTADKLKGTREIFATHGNMGSCTVLFALERVLLQDLNDTKSPSWCVLVGYGIGISIEIAILRAVHCTEN